VERVSENSNGSMLLRLVGTADGLQGPQLAMKDCLSRPHWSSMLQSGISAFRQSLFGKIPLASHGLQVCQSNPMPRSASCIFMQGRAPEKFRGASSTLLSLQDFLSSYLQRQEMSKSHSEASEDFEFIETPAAPTPVSPVEDCGVRTTSVSGDIPSDLFGFSILI
jgi:hypothetical protein